MRVVPVCVSTREARGAKTDMRVEKASIDDIPSWLSLAAEVEPLFGPMVDDPGFHNALRGAIECGGAFCVREADGPPGAALVGAIMFSGSGSDYKIGWLAVAERSRRNGVGRMLAEHVLRLAVPPATITVTTFREDEREGQPARRFYESLGFRPGGLRESHGLPRQVFTKAIDQHGGVSMTIRRLREGDEEAAVRVVEDLKFRMDKVVGVSVDPAYMRAFLADDRHYFIVAYIEDEPVGYAFGYRLWRFDGGPPMMFFYEVGVAEHHRRRGIGRALVEELKRLAKADGCGKMFVLTNRLNEAPMALYRSTGGEEGAADATALWWNW